MAGSNRRLGRYPERQEEEMQLANVEEPYSINKSSGACGIPQAYPCSKLLAVIGSLDNIEGQLDWMINYIANRYGTPSAAIAHHNAKGWY